MVQKAVDRYNNFGFMRLVLASLVMISSTGDKIGNISYGAYIFGFVVKQVFKNYFNLKVFGLMIVSIPVTYLLAYSSTHLLEKKMLKYKNLF